MNAKQKNFILRKLIPFISREHGRGFAMSTWVDTFSEPGELIEEDSIERKAPKCGTVACIGGSTAILAKTTSASSLRLSKILGITRKQANGLFYHWGVGDNIGEDTAWPEKFAEAFERAKTPYGKAMVAARLLKEVVKTEGACLNIGN